MRWKVRRRSVQIASLCMDLLTPGKGQWDHEKILLMPIVRESDERRAMPQSLRRWDGAGGKGERLRTAWRKPWPGWIPRSSFEDKRHSICLRPKGRPKGYAVRTGSCQQQRSIWAVHAPSDVGREHWPYVPSPTFSLVPSGLCQGCPRQSWRLSSRQRVRRHPGNPVHGGARNGLVSLRTSARTIF